jgi:hypothetical protein
MVRQFAKGRRSRALMMRSGATALAFMLHQQAWADCTPDPTQAGTTTTCSGLDADGIAVSTSGSTVRVPTGAVVSGSGGPAIQVDMPATADFQQRTASIEVEGTGAVDGGSQAGISVLSGSNNGYFDYYGTRAQITIGPDATVSGASGIAVASSSGSYFYNSTQVTLDNSGHVSGTAGAALVSGDGGGFDVITNQVGGRIDGIAANFNSLNNLGTVDGGTGPAVMRSGNYYYNETIANDGLITSSGDGATLASRNAAIVNTDRITNTGLGSAIGGDSATVTNEAGGTISSAAGNTIALGNYLTLSNGGAITNAGSALAIVAPSASITNLAGGTISATSGVAISAPQALNLTNQGTITGNVFAGSDQGPYSYSSSSRVDTASGTLTGNLIFGSGNDVLVSRYVAGQFQTGVNGNIDGGAGEDTLIAQVDSDATLSGLAALPTNFEKLALGVGSGATATLASGFTSTETLVVGGSGTLVNQGTLSAAGTALSSASSTLNIPGGGLSIVNEGTISGTSADTGLYAVSLDFNSSSFVNTGGVTSASGGVYLSNASFRNSGTIVAKNTAVFTYAFGDQSENSGLIRSTDGVGLSVSSYYSDGFVNSGTIEGATVGASLNSGAINTGLVNTGTIRSPGTAVTLSYGTLDNRSGGLIDSSNQAIYAQYNATILNAGTINGRVVLQNDYGSYNPARFVALEGGVLNGNLILGPSAMLITELSGAGTSGFAGINGTVVAQGSSVRYRVRSDASATLAPLAGFRDIGYDLYNGAALTLSANTDISQQLFFGGKGSVDLTANLVAGNSAAIITGPVSDDFGYPADNDLSIVSHGAITFTRTDASGPTAAVQLNYNAQFTNAGTVTVRDLTGGSYYYGPVTAFAGGNLINTGTITLENAYAFSGSQSVENSGTITGNGPLATNFYGTLTNSGTLSSTNGPAFQLASSANIDNQAGGVISGSGGLAIAASGGVVRNAGTIEGSVDLAWPYGSYSYYSGSYIAAGGTLNGDLRFGSADDLLVETTGSFGVTGAIDGGTGYDVVLHARSASATVALGDLPTGFESETVGAFGLDTAVTITGAAGRTSDIGVFGDGRIINQAATTGSVYSSYSYLLGQDYSSQLASFDNQADVGRTLFVQANAVTNSGNVGSAAATSSDDDERGIEQYATGTLSFNNSGTVNSANGQAVYIGADALTKASMVNSGTLNGSLSAGLGFTADAQNPTVTFQNSGTIKDSAAEFAAVELFGYNGFETGRAIVKASVTNAGIIEQTGIGGGALYVSFDDNLDLTVQNSGVLRSNAGGETKTYSYPYYPYPLTYTITNLASAIELGTSDQSSQITINNEVDGKIEATGPLSAAVLTGSELTLNNAGTISGSGDTTLSSPGDLAIEIYGTNVIAGAIQTFGNFDDSIVNSGTITGSVDLGGGNDSIVNTGTMTGAIRLGDGDDSFIQRISAALNGTVSGGAGFDTFRVDATGTGAIAASQLNGFERLLQTGSGSATWSGSFEAPTIELDGSTLLVAAGTTLQTASGVTVTGGSGAETVVNAGTIAGSVLLGEGNDTYRDVAGSVVTGTVDGGAGQDTYGFVLAGDRTVTHVGSNFENLAVGGSGTLSYALDQSFAQVFLDGAGLAATLGGQTIGEVLGGAGADALSVDGDVARVVLGGGDDRLSIGSALAAGTYDGGAGMDALTFAHAGPVTLSGVATGFETLALGGNALTVTGTLGATGDTLVLGAGTQDVTLAGGTLAGAIDLGAGDDTFHLRAGTLAGTLTGGAGDDLFSLETGAPFTLTGAISGFERFALGGAPLTVAGSLGAAGETIRFDDGDDVVTVTPGGSLTGTVALGGGNDRLTIAGAFAGSVDGGSGTDAVIVSGGSQSAPVAFGSLFGIESYTQSAGFATVTGTASLGIANLTGGRLVGLAGSTINAGTIAVQQGATFGSAGTVNANISVAGVLSPGASPGTMTVNGNVALGATSVSLFEITPTVSDKLVISGTLSIAQGATLQLVPTGTLQPGRTLDLVVTGGGITGSFTTVTKPASLFGVVVQSANRIQLLGQFLSDPSFSPQVQASIAYTNATLLNLPANSPLIPALPALAPGGVTDAAAFARLTPEPYASAVQLGVERGLTLARAARSLEFAAGGDTAHAFTFAQTLGDWSRIGASDSLGTARAKTQGYGFLGGIGFAAEQWAVGGFAGYLNEQQTIATLGARTKTDGVVAGVHVRYDTGTVMASGSVFYDGAKADTRRALPASGSADADYHLRGLGFDAKIGARLATGGGLAVTPQLGTTWIRTRRSGFVEGGGSPFALTVAGDRQWAGFADASLKLESAGGGEAKLHPWGIVGVRYQLQGRAPVAVAGFGGGTIGLVAAGAPRTRLSGTVEAGLDAQVAPGVALFVSGTGEFSGRANRAGVNGGVKVSF